MHSLQVVNNLKRKLLCTYPRKPGNISLNTLIVVIWHIKDLLWAKCWHKILFNEFWKMSLSEPYSFNKTLCQQSTNVRFFLSHNGIQRIKMKRRVQNILIWPCILYICTSTVLLTYDVMKSYLNRVWDKKIRNGYIILKTMVVMRKKLLSMSLN